MLLITQKVYHPMMMDVHEARNSRPFLTSLVGLGYIFDLIGMIDFEQEGKGH